MIGSAIATELRNRGDEVVILTRGPTRSKDWIQWDPRRGVPQARRLEGLDAVFNLTGAPLATRPWTPARRRLLMSSRVQATEALLGSLERLEERPVVFVGVGLLGRFGDRGDAWIDDDDPASRGFMAELAQTWEDAHMTARERLGARAVVLRLGMVLSATGGAFPSMLPPFRHGFGGWLGDGHQYTAWMSLRDTVRAFLHLLDTTTATGGFNGNVPNPVRNRHWCEALGHVVNTPVMTHAPKWALRGALGELADGVFLSSMRAKPRKLLDSGFSFLDEEVEDVFERLVRESDALA